MTSVATTAPGPSPRARERRVVISQPMLFPWVGLLEQARLADVWVHYDDVAFSKGSFTNRVQVKVAGGVSWLTIPLAGLRLGQAIREVRVDDSTGFRRKHLATLGQAFARLPHKDVALAVAERAYAVRSTFLIDLVVAGQEGLWDAFSLRPPQVRCSSSLGIEGSSSQRVLDVVRAFGGTIYVTGLGARSYLDHEAFERAGIEVAYMRYEKRPYPQRFGDFTPYVTALDLLANVGPDLGRANIASGTVPWRELSPS